MEMVVRLGLSFVVDCRVIENGADHPFFEVGKLNASLPHVVVTSCFTVLKVDGIIDMSEGVELVAADNSFR